MTSQGKMNTTELSWVLERASNGDESVLPMLKKVLCNDPAYAEGTGDLASQSEEAWISAALGDNLLARETVRLKIDAMRAELEGPNASHLEKLVVSRIIVCWLHLNYAETSYAQRMGNMDIGWANFCQKRLDRAQRRYLSAIKSLAVIRRLQLPTVQVNIGDKQINIAQNGRPTGRTRRNTPVNELQTQGVLPPVSEVWKDAENGP